MAARIVYVTSRLPFGTGEAFLIPEIRALVRMGLDVVLVPVRASGRIIHPDAADFGRRSRPSGLLSPGVLLGAARTILRHPGRSARATWQVVAGQPLRIMAKNLAVTLKGLWLGSLVDHEEVGHIHAYWASTPATVGLIASTVSGVPMSLTAHSWDISEGNCTEAKVAGAVVTRVISEIGQAELAGLISPAAASRLKLIHLGIDVPGEGPSVIGADLMRVVVPAAFVPFKGHRVLIESARLLQNAGVRVSFELIGDGPTRAEIEDAVARSGLGTMISFTGQMTHTALLSKYDTGQVDLVLLPSVTQSDGSREGIPISLVEAMGHGIPVIGTTCGGIPELLAGGAGLLVEEGQPAALAQAVVLLGRDPARRRMLALAGQARVRTDFDVNEQVRRLVAAARFGQ